MSYECASGKIIRQNRAAVQRGERIDVEAWMHPVDAKNLAWQLIREHQLVGWRFAFDHARRRFGSCRPQRKLITLSRPLVLLNSSQQVRDTLLHEIAHALTPGDGHGGRWKAKCVEIGAIPRRCYREDEVVAPARAAATLVMSCPRCEWEVPRRRRTRRRLVCKVCRGAVAIRERVGISGEVLGEIPSEIAAAKPQAAGG